MIDHPLNSMSEIMYHGSMTEIKLQSRWKDPPRRIKETTHSSRAMEGFRALKKVTKMTLLGRITTMAPPVNGRKGSQGREGYFTTRQDVRNLAPCRMRETMLPARMTEFVLPGSVTEIMLQGKVNRPPLQGRMRETVSKTT